MKTMESNYCRFAFTVLAVTAIGALTLAPAVGQDTANRGGNPSQNSASDDVAIPSCLKALELSQPQQNRIRQIVRDYDADLAMVWNQFGKCYMETVRAEALLLAAIEDNLTDSQRQLVRDQRRQTAGIQTSNDAPDHKPNPNIAKDVNSAAEQIDIVDVRLTAEQEAAADELQEKCLGGFRSMNREVEDLHIRLISLEADKLAKIEGVLTAEQLHQLREFRQKAPIGRREATKISRTKSSR